MKVIHQLNAFDKIFAAFDGSMPLYRFLPFYFKRNKQMGSTDRRWATRYIYSYFRIGSALPNLPIHQRLAVADFLCNQDVSLVVEREIPTLASSADLSLTKKLKLVEIEHPGFSSSDIFPFKSSLSRDVEAEQFYNSYLTQPKVFIRVAENNLERILVKLENAKVGAEQITASTLAFSNGTKLEQVLSGEKYQVQDYSSQKTGKYFKPKKGDKWWDCCAASGGKSLLLHSIEPQIDLLVSDVRPQSLENLKKRFHLAGLSNYKVKELDLLQSVDPILHDYRFDGIILDAPCTGSGTWGRSPEMLQFFDEAKISTFTSMQKAMVKNIVKYLKPGKPLIYITCSVFQQENEDVIEYSVKNLPLKLESMQLIKGYTDFADTMFVARLIAE